MTIYLPAQITSFREAFDDACRRIVSATQDQIFYVLCIELTEILRQHPLIVSYISEIENKMETLDREFSFAALQTFEEEWLFLWRMHAKYGAVRKALIRIRHLITKPYSISCTPIFHQINFDLLHVRSDLPQFFTQVKLLSFCYLVCYTHFFVKKM
ncbi:MAG TPA: hypothetical protein VIH61_05615 [Waddliaceae bacterium]